jgi:excisionase family DNA binding protein
MRQMMVIDVSSKNSSKKLKIASRMSVTVKGIANYCLVSESTVRRWIKDGKLSALRLPSGQYRVTATDFRDFLKKFDIPIKEI